MNIAWPENILGDKNWDKFEFFQGVWVSQVRGLRSEVWGLRFQGLNFRDTWKERAGKGGGGGTAAEMSPMLKILLTLKKTLTKRKLLQCPLVQENMES